MNWALPRARAALGAQARWHLLALLATVASVAVLAAVATRLGLLFQATALAAAALLLLIGLRWPLLLLFTLASLIPIEEAGVIGGLGTLSKSVGILFAVAYALPRLGRLRLTAMPAAGWGYLAWALASCAWALSPDVALAQLSTLVQLFLVAVLVADAVIHDPAVVRRLLWVYSLSATVAACLGFAAYMGSTAGSRVAALPGQDPAQFAALLLPAFVFSLHELLAGRRQLIAGPVALLATTGIILSGTRGAWVSAAFIVAVVIIPRLRLRQRVAAVIVVCAIVLVAVQIPGVADLVAQRTDSALATGGAGRTDIWAVGLQIIASAPIAGVGYANFPVAYTPKLIAATGVQSYLEPASGPHNVVIGTTGELGLIGLILLALFLVPLILRRGRGPDTSVVQEILMSLMISALFLDILGNRKQVWLAIGLAAGLAYRAHHARDDATRTNESWPPEIAEYHEGPSLDSDGGDYPRRRRLGLHGDAPQGE
jgi:O-antigen ligase